MTITTQTARAQYNGNGATTEFAIPFEFLETGDVLVIHTDGDGVDTTWVLDTQYAVTNADGTPITTRTQPTTGKVVVDTSPTDYTPATGEKLTILRNQALTQSASYTPGDAFPAKAHEKALDRLSMQIQTVNEKLARAPKLKSTSANSGFTFPEPEADKIIGWNADGDDLENKLGLDDAVDAAAASAAAAASSASAASTSATAAQTAETNAETAETNAETAQVAAEAAQAAAEAAAASIDPDLFVEIADTDASGFGFVIDEDTMASDSATKVPTQQSVVAYNRARFLANGIYNLDAGWDATGSDTVVAAAINQALTDAAADGYPLMFGGRTYTIGDSLLLQPDQKIFGVPRLTVITPGANMPDDEYLMSPATISGTIDTLYNGRLEIDGIEFDGADRELDAVTNAGLVRLLNCRAVVRNCRFHDSKWIGLAIGGTVQSLIEGNEFYNIGDAVNDKRGPALTLWPNFNDDSRNKKPIVRGNYFHDLDWSAIYAFQEGGYIGQNLIEDVKESAIWCSDTDDLGGCSDWTIEGNTIRRVAFESVQAAGIEVQRASNIRVLDNTVEECDLSGIFLTGIEDGIIRGNKLRDNITSTGTTGVGSSEWGQIHVRAMSTDTTDGLIIQGNRVRDTRGTKVAKYGIYLRLHASGIPLERVSILDNDLDESALTQEFLTDPDVWSDNWKMHGNKGFVDIRNAPIAWGGNASLTTTTGSDVVLATVPIPANSLGLSGALRITSLWSATNNANAKTPKVKLGAGTYWAPAMASNASLQAVTIIQNVAAENVQISHASAHAGGLGLSTGAVAVGGIDNGVNRDLTFTGQLATGTDTIALRAYQIELIRN